MKPQTITAFYADDLNLVFTFTENGDISADTFEFNVVDKAGALKFRVTMANITITSAGSVSTPGVVTVSIVDRLEIALETYEWTKRRTNAGREKVTAYGPLVLRPSWKNAV